MTVSASAVTSVVLLMCLVLVLFSILGMNLFGGLAIDPIETKDNFDYPQFTFGAWVRAVLPGQTKLRTARLIEIDTNRTGDDAAIGQKLAPPCFCIL